MRSVLLPVALSLASLVVCLNTQEVRAFHGPGYAVPYTAGYYVSPYAPAYGGYTYVTPPYSAYSYTPYGYSSYYAGPSYQNYQVTPYGYSGYYSSPGFYG